MNVKINGRDEALPEQAMTLQALVLGRGLIPERLVIEVNRNIISREQWPQITVRHGDHIEIISFVGGG